MLKDLTGPHGVSQAQKNGLIALATAYHRLPCETTMSWLAFKPEDAEMGSMVPNFNEKRWQSFKDLLASSVTEGKSRLSNALANLGDESSHQDLIFKA
jgi:hypothetical protein